MQTINAVIFDMDGLMLDTERLAQEAWQRVGREWQYDISDEVYLQVIGRTAVDTEALFTRQFGVEFPFKEMYAQKQAYLLEAINGPGIPVKAGLFELLDFLEQKGLRKAVATSTYRPLALKKLAKVGLEARFEAIVCGDEVSRGKPAPDIFLAAAEKLGVAPESCLALEDSAAGIQAAHSAGMRPVMIPDLIQPSAQTREVAFAILPSLGEVVGFWRTKV